MLRIRGKGPVYKLERSQKALMIESVLADYLSKKPSGMRILDIGCGNGDISTYFANQNEQYGVDIEDKRRPTNVNFQFTRIESEHLPYSDQFFDIVISHHVIEHVADQQLHLSEIARVLKHRGLAYLATPNKSSPIMQGHLGNNQVLRYHEMRPLFEKAGFIVHEYSTKVVKAPDKFHSETKAFAVIPGVLLSALRRWYPSHVFVLTPQQAQHNTARN